MRLQALIRTFYAFTNTTLRASSSAAPAPFRPALRPVALKSLPSIPLFGALFSTSKPDMTDYPVKKTDAEWQTVLSPEQFRVLREKGTEAPHTGEYDKHAPKSGVYNCVGCGKPLFEAKHKFSSGCGWPAFYDSIPGAVTRHTDSTFGMKRTEIVCTNCGGHLGHVFSGEGYPNPTDERHCVNSVSIDFHGDV